MNAESSRQLNTLPVMAWAAEPDGRCAFVNRRWAEYTGPGAGQPDWQAAVPMDDLPSLSAAWHHIVASGEDGEMQTRIRRHDGAERWFRIDCSPLKDDRGQVVQWFGVATDIDDRRRAKDVPSLDEHSLRATIETIPGMVWTGSPDGRKNYFNQRYLDYIGLTAEETEGWGWTNALHPDDWERVYSIWREQLKTGGMSEVEARVRRADGVYRRLLLRVNPLRDEAGNIILWYGVDADVEDQRVAEEALVESRLNLRLIVDTIPALAWSARPDGSVDFFNKHYQDFVGRTAEELQGNGWIDVIHPDDLSGIAAIWQAMMRGGRGSEAEARVRRSDGEYRWLLFRTNPVRDESGAIVKWYGINTDIDDRKRAEEALSISERSLKLTLETMPTMVWSADSSGGMLSFNQHYLDFLGVTAEQAAESGWTAFVHPDDLPAAMEAQLTMLATGAGGEHEARVRRHDGVYRWLMFRTSPLRDEKGNIVKWYGVITDIEDRNRAEDALRLSERNLRLTVDSILALLWRARPDGSADFFNETYLDFIGLTQEEAEGWGWTASVHPEDMASLGTVWQSLIASGSPGEAEARIRRHDGEYRWFLFRANPLHDESGAVVKWYGVNVDIEDRKRAEAELQRAYNSFADAQRLSHTGSFITDLVGNDHNWSDETYRIFEFEPGNEVSLERIKKIIHPDDLPSFEAMIARAMTGLDVQFLFRIVTPAGTVKHIHGLAHVIEMVAGHPLFVGALQDITDTKTAEEALNRVRSELAHVARVTALSTLTASIAHEVNQPLSGIITNANTCLRMLALDEPDIEGARETAKRTLRDGNRAAEVIKRLRGMFGNKPFAPESVDLNEAAREVILLSSSELQRNRISIQADFGDDVTPVTGDRVQLQQVILNLLLNASDAMREVVGRPRQIVVKTDIDEDGHARLSVRDTGTGLPPEAVQRLFEPFYTTKADGMGIGLSVSRSIIERHSGRMTAASHDGPGATVSFSLPRHSAQPSAQGN